MKSDHKCNCNVSDFCLCLDLSAISSHSALQFSIDHHKNVDVECAAFELVNIRPSKNVFGEIKKFVYSYRCYLLGSR